MVGGQRPVESAALETIGSHTPGGGWAFSGLDPPLGVPGRPVPPGAPKARPEEAREPSSGTAQAS